MLGDGNYTIALAAGIFATFNPCGFAMLPAYLSFIILGNKPEKTQREVFKDAAKFSALMGLGILIVFAIFAAAIIPFASSIQTYLPIFTFLVGGVLIVAGASLLLGRDFPSTKLWSPSISPTGKSLTYFGYGVTFALGSISCTIGPFLAITNAALASSNIGQILLTYISFGLGISMTIAVLALLTATSNQYLQARIRKISRGISVASAVILVLVGLYLIYFGWYEIQLSGPDSAKDPVMNVAFRVQGWIVTNVNSFLKLIELTQ
jgi:cytochrome c biogenesis protein CcdA